MARDEDETKKEVLTHRQRQSRLIIALCCVVLCFVAALTSGLILNQYNDDDNIKLEERGRVIVDCSPELRREEAKMRKSRKECLARGCTWVPQKEQGAPWCIFPDTHDYVTKTIVTSDVTGKSMSGTLTRGGEVKTKGVPETFEDVAVTVEIQTNNRVRVKLAPITKEKRWEIPDSILNIESTNDVTANASTSLVDVSFGENPFGIAITRKDTGAVVFNSSFPGTLLADKFLQLTTALPSGNLYGFGEHRHFSLRHNLTWKSWAMFTRDAGPNSDWNLYGQHPVYLNVEDDGKANIVLLKNSNAMEVLLQPEPYPAVTFTTIGGVLDFYVYVGDSPADVTSHYVKSIGLPVLPPYWSLGYHLCRWGYRNISDMQSVVERTLKAGIPYDGQWADIDSLYKYYPLTVDPVTWGDLKEVVDYLETKHVHFITILDPAVGANTTITKEIQSQSAPAGQSTYDMYQSGLEEKVFIMNAHGNDTEFGKVWPGVTVYPDFTNPASQDWWTKQIEHYVNVMGIKVGGLWIDMNEPSSFVPPSSMGCQNNTWNYPHYCPNILGAGENCVMFDKTICMDSRQNISLHYNVHSLYAHTMAMKTHDALASIPDYTDKRPWAMTRSSFVGTGNYVTKWTGDNQATWQDMRNSIISIMEFGIFGFALNGADICGFWLEPSYELCVRWHQLGAFYPFAKNHNGDNVFKDQDPASFGQDFVDLIKPALLTRYRILPYLYTAMYNAHTEGRLVMQPLFFQFPEDKNTLTIDRQFMLGDAMLVSPVLEEGSVSVKAYFPKGRWFDYSTGEEITSDGGKTVDLATPLNKFNLHIRGGHVIPWQQPSVNTFESRLNGLGLIVALDETGKASGELFWDNGVNKLTTNNYNILEFSMKQAGNLTIKSQGPNKNQDKTLRFETIDIYGLPRMPSKVTVNTDSPPKFSVNFISEGIIRISNLKLSMTSDATVSWSLY